MILRFVHGTALTSRLIIALEKTMMPFTPSHVEAVTSEKTLLGAHYDGGVRERLPGYDKDWVDKDLELALDATPEQDHIFYDNLRSKIGMPYDFQAIFGFIDPRHHHTIDHAICSALITGALRKCEWFKWPLTSPWHLVSVRDLLLMISAKMYVPL